MALIFLTYDASGNHDVIRKTLLAAGWHDVVTDTAGTECVLPNTTFAKASTTRAVALSDIKIIAGSHLLRAIALECEYTNGIPGDPNR